MNADDLDAMRRLLRRWALRVAAVAAVAAVVILAGVVLWSLT